jgi:putative membrane protein
MLYILIRWLILTIAVGLTAWLLPGFTIYGSFGSLLAISAVLGLINAIIRPIVMFCSCPLLILTLGLFTLVVNALMLSLTDWLLPGLMSLNSFWTTFFAALIISLISFVLGLFVHDENNLFVRRGK